MLFTSILQVLPAALLFTGAQGSPVNSQRRQTSVDGFVKSQADISIKGVLANIGTDGSKAQGASAGIVVASPSKSNPDCKYCKSITCGKTNISQIGTRGQGMPL
jgi:glucoamylase